MAEKVPDNPMGADFEKMPSGGQKYRAVQNVGFNAAGTSGLVARDFGPGAQIQRLLDQGLIVLEGQPDPKPAAAPRGPDRVPAEFRPESPEPEDPGSVHSPSPRPIGSPVASATPRQHQPQPQPPKK